jgi:hypothetical protein
MDFADQTVSRFLTRPILARIASVNPNSFQPQVDSVWFYWDGKILWITSTFNAESPLRLQSCEQCALVIEAKPEYGGLTGLLLEGELSVSESIHQSQVIKQTIVTRYLDHSGSNSEQVKTWVDNPEIKLYQLMPLEMHSW